MHLHNHPVASATSVALTVAPSAGNSSYAYSVVSDGRDVNGSSYYCTDFTMVHEVSHNMGSMHDRATVASQGGGQGVSVFIWLRQERYFWHHHEAISTRALANFPTRIFIPVPIRCVASLRPMWRIRPTTLSLNNVRVDVANFGATKVATVAGRYTLSGVVTAAGAGVAKVMFTRFGCGGYLRCIRQHRRVQLFGASWLDWLDYSGGCWLYLHPGKTVDQQCAVKPGPLWRLMPVGNLLLWCFPELWGRPRDGLVSHNFSFLIHRFVLCQAQPGPWTKAQICCSITIFPQQRQMRLAVIANIPTGNQRGGPRPPGAWFFAMQQLGHWIEADPATPARQGYAGRSKRTGRNIAHRCADSPLWRPQVRTTGQA